MLNQTISTRSTQQWQQLDAAHHLHPFSDMGSLNRAGSRVITRAEGVYLWDSEGNKIIDGMAGLWCVNVGYGRHELADAAQQQMLQLPYYNTFFKTTHPPVIELSHQLAQLTPEGFNHFFLLQQWLGRQRHGTAHRASVLGRPRPGQQALCGITPQRLSRLDHCRRFARRHGLYARTDAQPRAQHRAHWPAILVWRGGQPDASRVWPGARCRAGSKKFWSWGPRMSPPLSASRSRRRRGDFFPPETYWPEIERICRKYQVLLVADEVIGGFGRTGEWFAHQHFGFKPDLMTLAKGLTSGYVPMGAVAIQDHVAQALIEGGDFNHGLTYSGHPVAAAVALANIAILRDGGVIDTVKSDTGPYFQKSLREALAASPIIGEIQGHGLVAGMQFSPDAQAQKRFENGGDIGLICRDHCFANNLIMRATGDRMLLSPPLVISRSEIDELVEKSRALHPADGRRPRLLKRGGAQARTRRQYGVANPARGWGKA